VSESESERANERSMGGKNLPSISFLQKCQKFQVVSFNLSATFVRPSFPSLKLRLAMGFVDLVNTTDGLSCSIWTVPRSPYLELWWLSRGERIVADTEENSLSEVNSIGCYQSFETGNFWCRMDKWLGAVTYAAKIVALGMIGWCSRIARPERGPSAIYK